jgi:hypothetical protein
MELTTINRFTKTMRIIGIPFKMVTKIIEELMTWKIRKLTSDYEAAQ